MADPQRDSPPPSVPPVNRRGFLFRQDPREGQEGT